MIRYCSLNSFKSTECRFSAVQQMCVRAFRINAKFTSIATHTRKRVILMSKYSLMLLLLEWIRTQAEWRARTRWAYTEIELLPCSGSGNADVIPQIHFAVDGEKSSAIILMSNSIYGYSWFCVSWDDDELSANRNIFCLLLEMRGRVLFSVEREWEAERAHICEFCGSLTLWHWSDKNGQPRKWHRSFDAPNGFLEVFVDYSAFSTIRLAHDNDG